MKMVGVISVLTRIPNLRKELVKLAPNLVFKEITTENDYNQLSKSEIIIADFDLLIPHVKSLKETKWVQGTWAGVDKFIPYFNETNFHSTIVSRFSSKHFGRLMSEYVISNIINYERNFFEVYENQKQKLWTQNGMISDYRSIDQLTIGVLGVGVIGNYVSRMLHSFGATVWGFGRRSELPNSEEYNHYHHYCTYKTLPHLLKQCDYIINVLPSTNETIGLLNGNILSDCAAKKTVFINVGRGNIISEEDLILALKHKWLSAVILDVFVEEPLSKQSPLWDIDQVFITPHVSAVSRAKDIAEQFLENLEFYKNGREIPAQLKFGEKY